MKKMFTLLALLACFLGAKAEWVEDYSIDYSTQTAFPFYVMGYVPEWVNGVMTDYGANYRYETQATLDGDGDGKWKDGESSVGTVTNAGGTEYQKVTGAGPYWHQYIIANGVPMTLDGTYTVKAVVKATETVNANLQFGNWGKLLEKGVTIPAGTDFQEVEWEVTGCLFDGEGFICIQPGTSTATIEWKSLTVGHNKKESRPTVWQEWLTSDGQPYTIVGDAVDEKYMGDAEFGAWPSWSLETTDGINANWRGERTGEICAWALTMGRNFDDQCPTDINSDSYRARPYPADIELEPGTTNHVFVVKAEQVADIEGGGEGSIAWSNQFWIQSPKSWKEGSQIRIKFRYKAEKACTVSTQIHKDKPSNYLHYVGAGDVNFTTEWQEFDKTITFDASQATGWSLAFNLNSGLQETNTFYFDDLSWETMVLDEGYFIAGANTITGQEYDLDNAIEFEPDPDDPDVLVATVGTKDAYVDQVMISTVRGNDTAFKSATLKPTGAIHNDPEDWLDYSPSSVAKLNLPGVGIWKVYIDLAYTSMAFEMLEGDAKENSPIITNKETIVIEAVERDDLADNSDGTVREEEGGTGQTWDNQFFIVANRVLQPNEETVLEFDYIATTEAGTTTGTHAKPGDYRKNAIPDFTFTTAEQHLKVDYTVPASDWGGNAITDAQSIAFDLAMIKGANTYTIWNVRWYVKDGSNEEGKTPENLIKETGTDNFYVTIGKNGPNQYQSSTGISSVVNDKKATNVTYNLAGQRVSKDYKGIVIKNGSKYLAK